MPLPSGFVVKNGSKIRSRISSVIPCPVSLTTMRTYSPGAMARARASCSSSTTESDAIDSTPPLGIASRALIARFTSTCSSGPGSIAASPVFGAPRVTSWISDAEQPAEQRMQPIERRGDLHRSDPRRLTPSDGEQLSRHLRGAACGVQHSIERLGVG